MGPRPDSYPSESDIGPDREIRLGGRARVRTGGRSVRLGAGEHKTSRFRREKRLLIGESNVGSDDDGTERESDEAPKGGGEYTVREIIAS
jgi:hypothetical protein